MARKYDDIISYDAAIGYDGAGEPAYGEYVLEVDWDNDGDFGDANEDVTGKTLRVTTASGRDFPSQLTGKAVAGRLRAVLDNTGGTFSPFNTSSPLSGNLLPRRRVRLRSTFPLTQTLWTGQLNRLTPRSLPGGLNVVVLEAIGPLAALDTEVRVPMQASVRTDTAIGTILTEVQWASGSALSAGQTTMTRWWVDGAKALGAARDVESTESGFLHETRDGSIAFRDRHYRLASPFTTAQATLTDSATGTLVYGEIQQMDPLPQVFNEFRTSVTLFGTIAGTVLWTHPEAGTSGSLAIDANGTLVLWAGYPNADSPTDGIAVDTWITPVGTTDYVVNDSSAGTGNVITPSVSVAVSTFSRSMKITFTNGTAVKGYFQSLQARGTAVTASDSVTVYAEDGTSQTLYGKRLFPRESRAQWVPDTAEAQEWADFNLAIYKDPAPTVTVTMNGHRDTTNMNEMLKRDINDRVTLIATGSADLGIHEDYFVESIAHRITPSAHTTTFGLSPAKKFSDFWVLGQSPLGTSTRLGY